MLAWSLQRCREEFNRGVNLPNYTVLHDGNDNREYLQPVVSSGSEVSSYTLPEVASNKYFDYFIVYNAILAVYACSSALFRVHGAI